MPTDLLFGPAVLLLLLCFTLLIVDADAYKCDTRTERENKALRGEEEEEGGERWRKGALKECVATRWLRVMSTTKSIYIPGLCRSTVPVTEDYYRPTPPWALPPPTSKSLDL